MVWSCDAVHDLALRMQRRAGQEFRVGPTVARLVVDALFAYAAEHFRADHNHLIRESRDGRRSVRPG